MKTTSTQQPNIRRDRYAALRELNVSVTEKRDAAAPVILASYAAFERGNPFLMQDGDGYLHVVKLTDDAIVCDCIAPDGYSQGVAKITDFENWEVFCAQAVFLGFNSVGCLATLGE